MVIANKHKLLIGLALVLAVMLTYRIANPWRQQTVSKLTYARANKIIAPQRKAQNHPAPGRASQIQTNLLASPPQLALKVYRDPFRRPPKETVAQAPKPAAPKPKPQMATPDEKAREALRRFKAFGSFHQNGRSTLFLQRGKQVLVVNTGDRIDGKFKIEAIDGRSVIVSTADIEAPFKFEFEELAPTDNQSTRQGSAARANPSPTRVTPGAQPAPSISAMPYPEATEDFTSESGDEDPIPPLPAPPQKDNATLPPSTKESPSRDYLPGNKPREVN